MFAEVKPSETVTYTPCKNLQPCAHKAAQSVAPRPVCSPRAPELNERAACITACAGNSEQRNSHITQKKKK